MERLSQLKEVCNWPKLPYIYIALKVQAIAFFDKLVLDASV